MYPFICAYVCEEVHMCICAHPQARTDLLVIHWCDMVHRNVHLQSLSTHILWSLGTRNSHKSYEIETREMIKPHENTTETFLLMFKPLGDCSKRVLLQGSFILKPERCAWSDYGKIQASILPFSFLFVFPLNTKRHVRPLQRDTLFVRCVCISLLRLQEINEDSILCQTHLKMFYSALWVFSWLFGKCYAYFPGHVSWIRCILFF